MSQDLEQWIAYEIENVRLSPRVEIVDTHHFSTASNQALAQVRADESRATSYKYSFAFRHESTQSVVRREIRSAVVLLGAKCR